MKTILSLAAALFAFTACGGGGDEDTVDWQFEAEQEWYQATQFDRETVCELYIEMDDDEAFFVAMFEDDDTAPIERDRALMEVIKDAC